MKTWQILLVDDEPDVHSITGLVFRQKRWNDRSFELTSASSRAEAIELLDRRPDFQVAIVDMALEKETSGLELCEHIRNVCPGSMRLILRTGQPGLAPEERVLNELDIDHYVTKSDATPAKLYALVRASLRSFRVISTLMAHDKQLQSLASGLQDLSPVRLGQPQLLHDQMYTQRMQSIATMVGGVGHELNTRLRIARTANSRITRLIDSLRQEAPEDSSGSTPTEELKDVCQLLMRNLDRAQELIESFEAPPAPASPTQG